MSNPDKTSLLIVMDRSGSMDSIRRSTEDGIRKLVRDQASLPGEIGISLVKFNEEIDLPGDKVDTAHSHVWDADPSDFQFRLDPRGRTALYDAIVTAVHGLRRHIDALPADEQPAHVQVVVATDGFENASTKYRKEDVADVIDFHTYNLGWDFAYIGANQDAIGVGTDMGFDGKKSMTFNSTAASVEGATASLSDYIAQTRQGEDAAFTDAHRAASTRRGI